MNIKFFDIVRLKLENIKLTRINRLYYEQVSLLKDENEKLKEKISLYQTKTELDQLTNIYNRETFENQVKKIIANDESGVLAVIDIDDFKRINDTYGHSRGDIALIELAKKLKDRFRQTDLTGRFGGDEFLIFLKNTTVDISLPLLEDMIRLISEIKIGDIEKESMSVSMGVVNYNPEFTYDDNFNIADAALYESKRNGKGKITVGSTSLKQKRKLL